jgi:hypothetical protein
VNTEKSRLCVISAPFGFRTQALEDLLNDRNIRWKHTADLTGVRPMVQNVKNVIRGCDFLCGILTNDKSNDTVFFEIGTAIGLGVPVLIFVDPGAHVPFAFQSLVCIYVLPTAKSSASVSAQLDTVLQSPQFRAQRKERAAGGKTSPGIAKHREALRGPPGSEKPRPDVNWARAELARLSSVEWQDEGKTLESVLTRVFEEAGARVTLSHWSDQGIDMALWVEELQSVTGNPVLVQVKRTLSPESVIELRDTARWSGTRCALLVYLSNGSTRSPILPLPAASPPGPLVFVFSAAQVVDLVGSGKLFKEIIEKRNRLVHGLDE